MAKSQTTVLVLTSSGKDASDTVLKIGIAAKKYGCDFYAVSTQYAYVDDQTATHTSITINNYDGTGKSIEVDPRNVVCFTRGGVANTQIGLAILTIFEKTGMFVINERNAMELCANKLYTAIQLDKHKIPTPRTAFVSNLGALDDALEKIGNTFPVIVKTLTGAEGVGVSIVESYESLKSVLQTLWKYKAELLIQEYLQIKNDVRALVLDGKLVAAAMRGKAPKDFRTNLAQGAEGGPYKMSKEETQVAEQAAKAFDCYYVGVDMVLSDGKPYVIELNSSPGSGNIYRSYFQDSEGKDITGQKLIDSVVKYSINRDNWHYNHREAGLVEPVTIDGIDTFDSKLDTGNDGYNVLGVEDIEHSDGFVSFRIKGKKYKKPVVSHVRVRSSIGETQRRPVVELDITFRNRDFKNVRFSVVPRKLNKYQVLIGNRFLNLAKISVNVSKHKTLPESTNPYVQKIQTADSFVVIEDMREMLRERLDAAKQPNEAQQIKEALEYIDVAKFEMKNQLSENYNGNAIMHADKKFTQFLENLNVEILDSQTLELLSEAERQLSLMPKFNRAAKKAGNLPPKKKKSKKKITYPKFRQIVRRVVENLGEKISDEARQMISHDEPWPSKRARVDGNGVALGTGLQSDTVDGNVLGRYYRQYYIEKGKDLSEVIGIIVGKLKNMTKGVKPTREFEAGRGMTKWKYPRKRNPSALQKVRRHQDKLQGKLEFPGVRQTREYRGKVPSRQTAHGTMPSFKRVRDRTTGKMIDSPGYKRQIEAMKGSRKQLKAMRAKKKYYERDSKKLEKKLETLKARYNRTFDSNLLGQIRSTEGKIKRLPSLIKQLEKAINKRQSKQPGTNPSTPYPAEFPKKRESNKPLESVKRWMEKKDQEKKG